MKNVGICENSLYRKIYGSIKLMLKIKNLIFIERTKTFFSHANMIHFVELSKCTAVLSNNN